MATPSYGLKPSKKEDVLSGLDSTADVELTFGTAVIYLYTPISYFL